MKSRNMRRTWTLLGYVVLAGVAVAQSGCLLAAAAVAGGVATGVAYCNGKVCRLYDASFDHSWAACRTALTELGMPIVQEEHECPGKGYIESRTADGDKVRIHLEEQPSKFQAEGAWTRINVRVATFGDHPVSDRILDQVGAHLVPINLMQPPPPGAMPIQPALSTARPPVTALPNPVAAQTPPPPLAN